MLKSAMNPNDLPTGYMLNKDGVERGPYSMEQLDYLQQQNSITAFDLIRKANSETWVEVFTVLKTPGTIGQINQRLQGNQNSGNMVAGVASFILPGLGQLLQGRLFSAGLCLLADAIIWYATWEVILILMGLAEGLGRQFGFVLTLIYRLAAAHDAATYKAR